MDKRAQGLPITTIIIAILGLVVLVILFAITTGRLAIFAGVANECPGRCIFQDPKFVGPLALEPTECTEFERLIPGKFIKQGTGGTGETPVVCDKCCQRLA